MATTYSNNLLIALQGTGDNAGTWGTVTNGNLGTVLEEAIVGRATVNLPNTDVTISMTQGPATSPARCLYLEVTGSLSAGKTLTVPSIQKTYIIKNATTGGFGVTISSGGGTTVTVNSGKTSLVYVDGATGVAQQFNDLVSGTTLGGSAIVSLTATQTLTNKTLTSPTITGGTITSANVASVVNTGTITFPTTTTTLVGTVDTATMTNKRINPRVTSVASSATPTPDVSTTDQYNLTALAAAAAFGAPTGTPQDGQKLIIRIKDNGTARALTWNATYRVVGTVLPTTTVINKTTYVGCIYNAATPGWDVVAVTTQA
jgi:hypothetical protein